MKNLDVILEYLQSLDGRFHGQVVIRIREGRPVLITEERSIKLDKTNPPLKENVI